jgi:hypothetical protein
MPTSAPTAKYVNSRCLNNSFIRCRCDSHCPCWNRLFRHGRWQIWLRSLKSTKTYSEIPDEQMKRTKNVKKFNIYIFRPVSLRKRNSFSQLLHQARFQAAVDELPSVTRICSTSKTCSLLKRELHLQPIARFLLIRQKAASIGASV